ncbi:glutamyl-tRNA reductase [Limibacter armeniacum]|uniref:glutamyl-tRNA reductase n=1 Tax=Limibacter armeniacum TaxID=466084 RepID=UPI002FE522B1
MQNNFKAISLSYKSAPLEVRGSLSVGEGEYGTLLEKVKEVLGVQEALVVSTCNRTEVYYSSENDKSEELIKLLCALKGLDPSEYAQYFLNIPNKHEALQHLFRVSMGLESQVVGDLQISNQIKRSYQWTADTEMAGPFLHRLMHTVFFTNKRVTQETPFRDGAASVSYAAVEMVEELTNDLLDPKVLVVGVGEIGADVVRNLQNTDITNVQITNRTFSKAEELANECEFEAIPFENIWKAAKEADVIISSVAKADFFDKANVKDLDVLAFKCFMDLSVPRSVATDVESIPGVLVYDIDDINTRATKALERRKQAMPDVERIIGESIEEFGSWAQNMVFSPTIQKLKQSLEAIRQEEIAKSIKDLSDEEREKVEKITLSIMNKIIKIPVLQLKAACKRDDADALVDVLNDLFDLEKKAQKK